MIYLYKHPEKEEYVEVSQRMNDEHVFNDHDGLKWKRVFTLPNISIDSLPPDPYSQKDFVKATNKGGTVGDMLDLSSELSETRQDKDGVDGVKKKYFKDYENSNKVKHLQDKPKSIDNKHFSIDF